MSSVFRGSIFIGFFVVSTTVSPESDTVANSLAHRDRVLCPAELLVIGADARRLNSGIGDGSLTKARRRGLEKRIGAALSSLAIICRRYAAAKGMSVDKSREFLTRIRSLGEIPARDARFMTMVEGLSQAAPFTAGAYLVDITGNQDEQEAGEIYGRYCHGCHVSGHSSNTPSRENPAESLHDMATALPSKEFVARMVLGVKGTPEIGLSNPLTPAEIGAMMRHLRMRGGL